MKHRRQQKAYTRRRGWLRSIRGDFRRSQDGAAAIEFAICAPFFFMLVLGIFEVGINYFADRALNAGVDRVARQIRTGEIRSSATYGLPEFKAHLCNQSIMFLFDCNKLLVDVKTVAAFEANNYDTNPDGSVDTSGFGFNPGGKTTINVVRAFYEWPTIVNWSRYGRSFGYTIDGFGDGSRTIAASAAFLNEPFS